MRREIERKFLVTGQQWRDGATATPIRQGYVCSETDRSVRVRVFGDQAFLTIKGAQSGISRAEYEYEIPVPDAHHLLDGLCRRPLIEKTRYTLTHAGMEWVVDEFAGDNAGLVVAEVELESEDQEVDLPHWLGDEVSADPRYLNVNLAARPYASW